jgi:hypothetical protein
MKVSCWQNHFLLWRSSPARQAGYAEALGCEEVVQARPFSICTPFLVYQIFLTHAKFWLEYSQNEI